jgi:hypothetical protein
MARFVFALALLALPALTPAEEIFRWRDANGTLNYSNQPAHVPSDALRLRPTHSGLATAPGAAMAGPETPTAPLPAFRSGRQEV